jgi:peroxiredoxin Q/BCP
MNGNDYLCAVEKLELLEPGTEAPDFEGLDQHGKPFRLSSLRGSKVVLYFYPKDHTPGCTKEACNLRDHYEELKKAGYEVVGVSTDPVESHKSFAETYQLPFTLVADPNKHIVNLYKVWGKKKLYGKEYEGTLRVTYIIDENGVIERVIKSVKTDQHAEQILNE